MVVVELYISRSAGEEEEMKMEEERGTILDLGDGNLINKDWNNTTVSEEVSSIY